MTSRIKDLTGMIFGYITAIKPTDKRAHRRVVWECLCNCNSPTCLKRIYCSSDVLCSGASKSCRMQQCNKTIHPAIRRHFSSIVGGAYGREHKFELTILEFINIVKQPCFYCGNTNDIKRSGKYGLRANGVDRVDNTIGYIISNCVPCCKLCNFMKRDLTASQFIQHARKIVDFNVA